jgi:hypothetical protein
MNIASCAPRFDGNDLLADIANCAEKDAGARDEWLRRMAASLIEHHKELVEYVASWPDSDLAPVMHPNGFIRCDLYRSRSGTAIRLHFWPVGLEAEPGIHDHRWHFASLILAGAYVETKYAYGDTVGTTPTVECHRVDRSNVRIVDGVPVSLLALASKRFSSGMTNCRAAGEFHRVDPDHSAGICVSLVVTAPPVAAAARVLASVEANKNFKNIHYANVSLRTLRHALAEGRFADVAR